MFDYFAYGSNLLTERLRQRGLNPTNPRRAYADDRIIEFSKPSMDKSGKATLRLKAGNRTPGVLFKISKTELKKLDDYEGAGKGYDRYGRFPIHLPESNKIVYAVAYLATCPNSNLKPYDWYIALVIAGVIEHGLDDNHLIMLWNEPYLSDPNYRRKERCKAVEVLAEAGFPDYRRLLNPT